MNSREKTFDAISKLQEVERELLRLRGALDMVNKALDAETEKPWVGLNWDDLPEIYVGDKAFMHGAKWAEAKLKEKNT